MLRGADIVLRCLRAEGVDLVFGYPGGAIMPLYDALEGSGVRHILTRHEQGLPRRDTRGRQAKLALPWQPAAQAQPTW